MVQMMANSFHMNAAASAEVSFSCANHVVLLLDAILLASIIILRGLLLCRKS